MPRRLHVIPIGDDDIHCAQETCWCYPLKTDTGSFAHNAKDTREARERVTGEIIGEGWVLIGEVIP